MIDLITARRGTPHVSPQNDATIWRSVIGEESGVFDFGGKMVCAMASNGIQVADGIGMIQGRFFRHSSPEVVAVTFPPLGTRRNDILCIHVIVDNDEGTQDAELVILENTNEPPVGDLDDGEDAYYMLCRIIWENRSIYNEVNLISSMSETHELARYKKFHHISHALDSSGITFAHRLPQHPTGMFTDDYEVVNAYAVSADGNQVYPIPYTYEGSGGIKFLSYSMNASNVVVVQNASWSGYTLHLIVGEKQ